MVKALQQHFTNASDLNNLMASLLGRVDNQIVLEPSIGEGALLKNLIGNPKEVIGYDVDSLPFEKSKKFNTNNIKVTFNHVSFIDDFLEKPITSVYDSVIANPPYGLNFSIEYRKKLKEKLPEFYVKESYGLFLYMSLKQLKEGGRYVFLIPDTFLTSNRHVALRKFLAEEACPSHIIRIPSKSFETVSFKYGNLCVIAGNKEKLKNSDTVVLSEALEGLTSATIPEPKLYIQGEKLITTIEQGWSKYALVEQESIVSKDWLTLGDLAECKTGIYTGDNVTYIGFDPLLSKRKTNGHVIDWKKDVYTAEIYEAEKLNGLKAGKKLYVPFIRGGHRDVFEKPSNAILWSEDAIKFYKENKKSRFQNASFYFREGISMPMVSSSRISASYMKDSVFDQGVVGIFPNDKKNIEALIIYLNSSLASKLMKGLVNGSANNSANYIKQLPVPNFTREALSKASSIFNKIKADGKLDSQEIDNFVENYLITNQDN
ncbi:Eco57I restriction-modification methylase domain-containing protein [Acinetobacter sp. YH16058]|uniref:Eco57I restriction-modification methylase domain-containing protein n=2 Tax=unclassified Acinetobacter TaxID=196816 RepID=UPI0015D37667|nr:N-6 DNA methylase [Acinetobacter sp. YH16058]